MRPKFGYLAILFATILFAATSCTVKDNINPDIDKFRIRVSQVAASTGGITISWIDDKGDNVNYTVKVYTDAKCTELYQQYALTFDAAKEKRFSVPYLDTSRKYYICIENIMGYKSDPFEVDLAIDPIRRNVLSQNFDKLFWGYDYINSSNGVKLVEGKEPATYIIESLTDAIEDSEPATNIDDHGGLLFKYKAPMLELLGFEGWPSGSEVRIMPGYVRIGNAYNKGTLRTPTFSVLEDKAEDIAISFNAAIFASSLEASGGKVELSILKGNGSVIATKTFNIKGINGKPSWNNFSLVVEDVTADCYCEIKSTDSAKQICVDNLKITRHLVVPEGYIYGYTYDEASGNPIGGVAVSDGFSVVVTDNDGLYMMKPSSDAWYVFYSIPANCEVVKSKTGPLFFSRITNDTNKYDFELKLRPDGKKEEKFALLTFADPQVSSSTGLKRFKNEAIPGIKEFAKTLDIPCYGITLGDIISNSTTDEDHYGTETRGNSTSYMPEMLNAMRPGAVGFPIFQVMGNHDCNYFGLSCPLEPDSHSSTYQLKAQREFETIFGPINYSFNRGDVHIIGMRDIFYENNHTTRDYETGFLKEQYEWLVQDLAVVPKDKMVVLCVHIPLFGSVKNSGESGHYVKEVHQLLDQYKEAHIISGHTHYQRNYEHPTYNIYEHNMGTVCGTWWSSNICGDGTPNGFGVFVGEGNTFSDWYYMGYHEGMNTRNDQLRLHRGNAITGAKRQDKGSKNGTGYYAYNFSDDTIIANVYNADDKWTIEVYEDDVKTGEMTRIANKSVKYDKLVGSYTMEDPRHIADNTVAPYDMWSVGIQVGELNRVGSNGSWIQCYHLYRYILKNKDAKVKVVAIDRFGNRYTADKFVDYQDNTMGKKP